MLLMQVLGFGEHAGHQTSKGQTLNLKPSARCSTHAEKKAESSRQVPATVEPVNPIRSTKVRAETNPTEV